MKTEITSDPVSRFQVLTFEEVQRLNNVLEDVVPIHGRGNFPTLQIQLKELTNAVREKLKEDGIHIRDIRLNGGAASYVVAAENHQTYTDLDLIFGVELSNAKDLEKIKAGVLDCLLQWLPDGVSKDRMSSCMLKEAYVKKLVKVLPNSSSKDNGDMWSLISLNNNKGKNVELKFVNRMKRQFEFSVDSFQIVLDSLLVFYDFAEVSMSENFYPTVVAESIFGDYVQALYHLQCKLIATRNPEEIRGGGLLKYCTLLARGYAPSNAEEMKSLERYMCSRFFIDFPDVGAQKQKLESYATTHFANDDQAQYPYYMILHRVVNSSTVCLMNHERRQILQLIEQLAYDIHIQMQEQALLCMQQNAGHVDSSMLNPCLSTCTSPMSMTPSSSLTSSPLLTPSSSLTPSPLTTPSSSFPPSPVMSPSPTSVQNNPFATPAPVNANGFNPVTPPPIVALNNGYQTFYYYQIGQAQTNQQQNMCQWSQQPVRQTCQNQWQQMNGQWQQLQQQPQQIQQFCDATNMNLTVYSGN